MISVIILSASASFAIDDDILQESDDGIYNEELSSVEEDSVIEATDEVSLSDENKENELLSDPASNVVTNTTFHDYFDETGVLTSDADELVFEGDFSGLDVSVIYLMGAKPIKLTGNGATFKNVQFAVMQSDVTINGFNFKYDDGDGRLINIAGDSVLKNIEISNNNIDFTAVKDYDSYAIYAGADSVMGFSAVSSIKIINNTIAYVGVTNGSTINNVIRIEGDDSRYYSPEEYSYIANYTPSNKILIESNNFTINIPSTQIDHPDGFKSTVYSAGIEIYYCDDVVINKNNISLKYNTANDGADSIYVVSVSSDPYKMDLDLEEEVYISPISSNVKITNNNIDAVGNKYIYGVVISADEFEISDNVINVNTEDYYAAAIELAGPATNGVLANNNLSVKSKHAAYGVYSEGKKGAGKVDDISYEKNNISADAYFAVGLDLYGWNTVVKKNSVIISGNYTFGIFTDMNYNINIEDNTVLVTGNNVGTANTGDELWGQSVGIKVKQTSNGKVIVKGNDVTSTDVGIDVTGDVISIESNEINVDSTDNVNNFAVYANKVANLTIVSNNVTFKGKTDGYKITNAMYIASSENATIEHNIFNISIPSVAIPWSEVPEGSGNWVQSPVCEGIVIDSSNGAVFKSNEVTVKYTDIVGFYDTIYMLHVSNSDSVSLEDNSFDGKGHTYIYGILISGNDFNISGNGIKMESDISYANGIDVEGPASGIIENNKFTINSVSTAYPIYTAMSNGNVSVDIKNNNISADAYFVCGIELAGNKINVVKNNIELSGNYTIAVGSKAKNLTVDDNTIIIKASNIGSESIWDGIGVETAGIKITEGNADIIANNIATSTKALALKGNEIKVSQNTLNVKSIENITNYGIYADSVSALTIDENNLTFEGNTNGMVISNAIFISNSNGAVISGNELNINLTSSSVGWAEVPAGSGNWVSSPVSEGVVIDSSNNVKFEKNHIFSDYNGFVGDYDTLYIVDVKNSDNSLIKENLICGNGHSYIYGVLISGNDFNISGNQIEVRSDASYANGIDIEGSAKGTIENNIIVVDAPSTAYPIYGGMSSQDVSVDIKNNEIYGEAYLVYGIQLGGDSVSIEGNTIQVEGNHTIGIGTKVNQAVISGNTIISNASNNGTESIWDGMGTTTGGILIKSGDVRVMDNNVNTTGDKALSITDANVLLKDNTLESNNASGDDAIESNTVINKKEDSLSLKVILIASDLTKTYGNNDQYVVTVFDENGNPVSDKVIVVTVNGATLKANTNDKGVAAFDIDLAVGNYVLTASFEGNVVYAPKNITNNVVINAKPVTPTPEVKKVATKITAKKKTFKAKTKTKKYTITLKAGKNPVKKVRVTLKVKGKTVKATTNAKGKATFKIKNLKKKGKYTATIKFAGKGNYLKTSKKVKITVKK